MPLPDERPRQSVANLIGRFETQQKRSAKSEAPKPIQLPGGTVSGLQDRKSSLGPDLANNLARITPVSNTTSESVPDSVIEQEKVEPTISTEPPAAPTEESSISPVPEIAPAAVEASEPVLPATQRPLQDAEQPKSASPTLPRKAHVKKASTPGTSAASPSSSRATTLKLTKARSPPPSTPMTKSNSATQPKPSATTTEVQPIRPHFTGNSFVRGAVSPIPHYMMPLRPQNTGPVAEGKVRTKASVTKQPRTSTANGTTTTTTTTSSHLMAPTASSLAKARSPVAAGVKSNNAATTTPARKAATKTSDSTAQTPVRERTTSSTVPFPSARKAKTSTGPASTTKPKADSSLTSQTASSRRISRISQSSSKGPSAAALAALAKVGAPPVPTIPTFASISTSAESNDALVPLVRDVVVAPAAIHESPDDVESVAPPALVPDSTAQILELPAALEPAVGGNGKVPAVDPDGGAATAPPAKPLTKGALAGYDDALENVTGGANGGTFAIAVKYEDAQQIKEDPSSKSVPSSPVLRHRHQHDLHVVPPTPASPTMDRDHGHQSVDPILGPVPFGNGDDELKDDAYLTDKSGKTNDIPDMD